MSLDITPYCTIDEAYDYFSTRLDTEDWDSANSELQVKALKVATRLINNLNFKGCKLDPLQINEFPRSYEQFNTVINDTEVPDAIKIATCEIAINLLDGTDIEQEIENLFAVSQTYASVTTGYIGSVVPDYMRAGIPSAVAWAYLRPYLSSRRNISISRVN